MKFCALPTHERLAVGALHTVATVQLFDGDGAAGTVLPVDRVLLLPLVDVERSPARLARVGLQSAEHAEPLRQAAPQTGHGLRRLLVQPHPRTMRVLTRAKRRQVSGNEVFQRKRSQLSLFVAFVRRDDAAEFDGRNDFPAVLQGASDRKTAFRCCGGNHLQQTVGTVRMSADAQYVAFFIGDSKTVEAHGTCF